MFLFIYLLISSVLVKKIQIRKHQTLMEVELQGQLVTPLGYPIGTEQLIGLTVEDKTQNLVSDILGKFSCSLEVIESTIVAGKISMNIESQFQQTYTFSTPIIGGRVNLGQVVVNDNQTQETYISGQVVGQDTKKPIQNAMVTLNYSHPILLDTVNIATDSNGNFNSTIKLMRLLAYGVEMQIEMQGYNLWSCSQELATICPLNQGIALYNQFEYQFPKGIIQLAPDYINAFISVMVVDQNDKPLSGIQVSALCLGGDIGAALAPVMTNAKGVGYLVSNQVLRSYQSFYCTIWTLATSFQSQFQIIELNEPKYTWDGTTDENLFIRL